LPLWVVLGASLADLAQARHLPTEDHPSRNRPTDLAANPGAGHIDVNEWKATGGIGVLHYTAPATLLELSKLGII
jgi:hypothetical protein